MGAAADGAEIVRLSKEHAELKPVVEAVQALERARAEAPELEAMARGGDAEMAALAREELETLNERLPALERDVALMLAPRDKDENASAILEVRAGTGGDEAALFAGDLFRMYQRYAQNRGWRVEVESASEGEVGGYKEIIASITGEGVFGRLKFESGVHRVQRVPETEASGRIHTSASTVAVLPEAEDIEVDIDEKDLKFDIYHSGGAGGQNVNKVATAVRVTHIPTGIVVQCQDERSQLKNKTKAVMILKSRLLQMKEQEQAAQISDSRRSQVGGGDRSEKIRTYNFPQDRVTDHRVGYTRHNLQAFLDGEIDDVVDAVATADQARRLEESLE